MILANVQKYLLCLSLVAGPQPLWASSLAKETSNSVDAFTWQNEKHFAETLKKFSLLAEREFKQIIDRTLQEIDASSALFKKSRKCLIKELQETIYEWMQEDVLSEANYQKEKDGYFDESENTEESDEEPWLGNESDEDSTSQSQEDRCQDDCESEEGYERNLESWRLHKIDSTLGSTYERIEDFTQESLTMGAIKEFLSSYVEGGYSWLINEKVIGTFATAEAFSEEVHERAGIPRGLLYSLLEGLWFDYDWEQHDIEDPLYIAHTIRDTLRQLKKKNHGSTVKERIQKSLIETFSFNENNFEEPLSLIKTNYNAFIRQNNWLGALIEWSIYCVYRKLFIEPSVSAEDDDDNSSVLGLIEQFNRQAHIRAEMEKARTRAHEHYAKVHLHRDTSKVVFIDKKGRRGELPVQEKLQKLKSIGKSFEPHRPRGRENIFVPQLFIIVQGKGSSCNPEFIEIPLKADELEVPHRPLTKKREDTIFKGSDADYFSRAEKDFIAGRVYQGKTRHTAKAEIQKILQNPVGRNTDLIHSERVLMEALRKPEYCAYIVEALARRLEKGIYKVRGLVMLGYSTNSICPQCTPTLISLMNSHQPGKFMHMLVEELKKSKGEVRFKVPLLKDNVAPTDWTKFRMNLFITAQKAFQHDCQAVDFKEGTHARTAPGPDAHLYLKDDECILSDTPQLRNGTADIHQRFFYEFVGDEAEEVAVVGERYPNILFSSGSTQWA